MGWFIAIGLALLVAAAIILPSFLPRPGLGPFFGALLLGLIGYAWQGRPNLSGSPRPSPVPTIPLDNRLPAPRLQGERLGNIPRWLLLYEGLARQRRTGEAANMLADELRQNPDDGNLWAALGNALTVHSDGLLSPAAEFAFRRAMQIDPNGFAAPYFYGLALARSGDIDRARTLWMRLILRLPENSPIRAEIQNNLSLADQLLKAQ